MEIPKMSFAIGALGIVWGIISFFQWGVRYEDISQLIFGLAVAFGIVYVAYDYWWKKFKDKGMRNLSYRIDSIKYPGASN